MTMNCSSRCGLKALHGWDSLTKRILVIGGFGFVGGRLAVHLAQAGHHIVLGTRSSQKAPTWLPQATVAQIQWDNDIALEASCNNIEVVIHSAGMNAQDCLADPVAGLSFNGVATSRSLAAAIRAGVKRFIYLSTAHVYASPLSSTITEETCPHNLHPYATSHLAGEYAVLGANQREQIQGVVLRLSNTFGAPMHKNVNCWTLLINDLCRQAIQTRNLVLQSNGLQYRDFIGLGDVCRAVERLAGVHEEAIRCSLFNVGSGVSHTALAMAQLIQQRCLSVLGFEPELRRAQCRDGKQPPMLNYRADNLAALGINFDSSDNTVEIDALLRYCHSTFSRIQTPAT